MSQQTARQLHELEPADPNTPHELLLLFDKPQAALHQLRANPALSVTPVDGTDLLRVKALRGELERLFSETPPEHGLQMRAAPATEAPSHVRGQVPLPIGSVALDDKPLPVRPPRHHLVTAVCTAPDLTRYYQFPAARSEVPQKVGIILCGGGVDPESLRGYYGALGLSPSRVTVKGVGGAKNDPASFEDCLAYMQQMAQVIGLAPPRTEPPQPPRQPFSAPARAALLNPRRLQQEERSNDQAQWTLEGVMDVEMLTGVAPGLDVNVYVCRNTAHGVIHALLQALADGVSVVSCSWGWPEQQLSSAGRYVIDHVLSVAAHRGMTVVAAAGNEGAGCLQYPAVNPQVLAVGGTLIDPSLAEVTWNETYPGVHMASAGGYSTLYPRPRWQQGHELKEKMRGVPDVSANAAANSAAWAWLGASDPKIGMNYVAMGTSSATPVWAGLIATVNRHLGAPVGFVNPRLYRDPRCVKDIIHGNNGLSPQGPSYSAGPGWDACTGLGTPRGERVLEVLRSPKAHDSDEAQ